MFKLIFSKCDLLYEKQNKWQSAANGNDIFRRKRA